MLRAVGIRPARSQGHRGCGRFLVRCDRLRPVRGCTVAAMETDIRDRSGALLTRRQVEARCCLSTSSIYRFMRDGLFPEPIRVGRRAVRWHASEVDAWLASRPRATGDRPSA